jgi:hypothetical protein
MLDFVKNLWGGMNMPGMSVPGIGAPVMSLEDLEKKIADLKAVEAWLNVNVAMLRGTIQALEVQRGTIATLKTMSASFAEAMKQPGADEKAVLASSPFAAFFTPPQPPAGPPDAAAAAPQPAALPAMPDPTMWWNALQDQFTKAVTNAMAPEAVANMSTMAQEAAERMREAAAGPAAAAAKPDQPTAPGGGGSPTPRAPKAKAGKP